MQPDRTAIRRRADGTIDTVFYTSQARSLRQAAKQDILRGIVHAFVRGLRAAISFWNIPTLHGGDGMGRQNQRRW